MISFPKEHHKFLKQIVDPIEKGDYLVNAEVKNGLFLSDLVSNHLFIVFLSTSCSACEAAFEAIDSVLQTNPKLNTCFLIDTDLQNLNAIKEALPNQNMIFSFPYNKMNETFGFARAPWGIAVNKELQIISSGPFGKIETLDRMLKPFKYQIGEIIESQK